MTARVCVARIGAAHGLRGEVRLWTFTEDPMSVTRYGPLSTKDGARQLEVAHARTARDHLIARDRLPATDEGEYYHADLIGLAAVDAAGTPLGTVAAIHNFGAGDIIEIAPAHGPTLMLPFTDAVVPVVDLAGGRVVIEMPGEIEGEEPDFDPPGVR